PRVRRNLELIFTVLGYAVRASSDGSSALDAITEEVPDIILSDLEMPGMSGFEFLSVVRHRFPSVRVVAMSKEFAGKAVPPGAAADAFYEKGRHLRYLLKIMEAMTRPGKSIAVRLPRLPLLRPGFPPQDSSAVIPPNPRTTVTIHLGECRE
ncbi:MAG: response regulator, partial [Acidobacteriaceae bacterium]